METEKEVEKEEEEEEEKNEEEEVMKTMQKEAEFSKELISTTIVQLITQQKHCDYVVAIKLHKF